MKRDSAKKYRVANRDKINAKQREWCKLHPLTKERQNFYKKGIGNKTKEKYLIVERNRKYLKRYGLTLEEYNLMNAKQNGLCWICNQPNITGQSLYVDHNHTTGKVRKLLCNKCNKGIGDFDEDISRIERAIQYLKDHTE